MDKNYNHTEIEKKCITLWDNLKTTPNISEIYSLVLPPPNANSNLHTGHTLNATIHDILIRYKKMQGIDVSFKIGVDHGGISTQQMVYKQLTKDGKNPFHMPKEELIKEMEKYKDEKSAIILDQIKRIGILADWTKVRYTRDEKYSKLVKESFVQLYNDGMIYKGLYLCNYCFKCGTAISDDEVNTESCSGNMYYLKYKLENSDEYLTLGTTRPETLFGDTAVAVNPDDERYKKYVGMKCLIPITNKLIPIIMDKEIDPNFGTGCMKVTPAHNKVDNVLGKKHSLGVMNIIDKYGKLCNTNTSYDGIKIHMIKDKLLEELKSLDLLAKVEKYDTLKKSCYKCNSPIENIMSEQWFLKMSDLAEKAKSVVDELNFYPEFHRSTYMHWLSSTNDWCISRQLLWGDTIPASTCNTCNNINVSCDEIISCQKCGSEDLKSESDVYDTWFCSWLYSYGVFESKEDYDKYFPLNAIISGSDILFFWITRMIMASLYFKKKIPFKDIYLHGIVRDDKGIKMSKTLGNGIDPLTIIDKLGADALRFGLVYKLAEGRDLKISTKDFDVARSFCTKIWNSTRYILMNRVIDPNLKVCIISDNTDLNNDILNKYKDIKNTSQDNLDIYDFHTYAHNLYTFFWREICDKYLEAIRSETDDKTTQTLLYVFIGTIRLLHPIIPFITTEICETLKSKLPVLDLLFDIN